jgi:hypothetical protein
METILGIKGAKIDRIYFCPHHPDKGYPEENPIYKIKCICRKPEAGMIIAANNELNIDLENSFLIGDQTTDIMTAKNRGLISIGIRGGFGCKDGKYNVTPDIWADDLQDAIDIILSIKKYNTFYNFILDKIKNSKKIKFVIAVGGLKFSNKDVFSFFLNNFLQRKFFKCSSFRIEDLKLENNCVAFVADSINEIMIINDEKIFNFEKINKFADLKVFISIDEKKYKRRFYNFYRWQDLKIKKIRELYEDNLEKEISVILKNNKKSDLII